MALIAIAKKHHLSHQKAKAAAGKVAKDLNERFDLEYTWKGDHVEFKRSGLTLYGYPALVDRGPEVSLRLFDSQESADHECGVILLF